MRGNSSANTKVDTIQLPKASIINNINNAINNNNNKLLEDITGAQDTIYLCNFRVSVDGEWLCLKELQDLDMKDGKNVGKNKNNHGQIMNYGTIENNDKCDEKIIEREWVNYCRCYL